MVKQSEQEPTLINLGDEEPTTRRTFVKALVGTAAAGFVVAGYGEAVKSGEGSQETDFSIANPSTLNGVDSLDGEDEVYFDQETFREISKEEWEEKYGSTGEKTEMDLTHPVDFYDGRRDPQHTRELAEGKRGDLRRGFTTYTSEVSSSREYLSLWAEDWEGWLNAGCTPEEIEPFLALDGDLAEQMVAESEYLQEMHKKYDPEIYKAMTGDSALQYSMYSVFCDARQGVLRRFLGNARKNGNLRETARVSVVGYEELDSLRSDTDYLLRADIQVTNKVDGREDDVYEITGKIGMSVAAKGSTLTSTLVTASDFDIIKPFKELAQLK